MLNFENALISDIYTTVQNIGYIYYICYFQQGCIYLIENTFAIIINAENRWAAQYFCGNYKFFYFFDA